MRWVKGFLVAAILFAAGCSYSEVDYRPAAQVGHNQAVDTVGQFLTEQPGRFRLSKVKFGDDYMEPVGRYGRIYYAKIHRIGMRIKHRLFTTNKIYVVELFDKNGKLMARFVSRNGDKSRRFIDSLTTLKNSAGGVQS